VKKHFFNIFVKKMNFLWLLLFILLLNQIYDLQAFRSVSFFHVPARAKNVRSFFKPRNKERLIPEFNPEHNRRKLFQSNHTLIADRLKLLEVASKEGKSIDFLVHLRFLANRVYPSFLVQNKLQSMLKTLKDYFSVQTTGSLFITLSEMGIRSNHSKFNDISEKYIDKFFEGNYAKTPDKILGFLVSMRKFRYEEILKPAEDIQLPPQRLEFIDKRRKQFLALIEEICSMETINEKQFITLSATIGQLSFRWNDLSAITKERFLYHFHQNDRKFDGMLVPLLIYNLGRMEVPARQEYEADFVCLLEMAENLLEWTIQNQGKYKQNTIIVRKRRERVKEKKNCYFLLSFYCFSSCF
jgi:hypothetical protein